jgi:hypothetical protein
MEEQPSEKWWRKPLIYSLVVVAGVAIGATVVFIAGSANRRSDRKALVAYERAMLPHLKEAGRIVQQEMKPTLREVAEGSVSDAQLLERTAGWQLGLERVRKELLALSPPALLGSDFEDNLSTAMGGYLLTVDAFTAIANAPPDQKTVSIEAATTFGERADDLFDDVAGIIQFHRKRLGLGPSSNLPDP